MQVTAVIKSCQHAPTSPHHRHSTHSNQRIAHSCSTPTTHDINITHSHAKAHVTLARIAQLLLPRPPLLLPRPHVAGQQFTCRRPPPTLPTPLCTTRRNTRKPEVLARNAAAAILAHPSVPTHKWEIASAAAKSGGL